MTWLLVLQLLNPTATPGVVRPLSTVTVCTIHWGLDRRFVTKKMKRDVAARYHLTLRQIKGRGKGKCCEFDHLIPRSLAGADDPNNLWPQPWKDAEIKDRREVILHRLVCRGTMDLHAAQEEMRSWHR